MSISTPVLRAAFTISLFTTLCMGAGEWQLYDDFDDNSLDTSRWQLEQWTGGNAPTEVDGRAKFEGAGSGSGLDTKSRMRAVATGITGMVADLVLPEGSSGEAIVDVFAPDSQHGWEARSMIVKSESWGTFLIFILEGDGITQDYSHVEPAALGVTYRVGLEVKDDGVDFLLNGAVVYACEIPGFSPDYFRIGAKDDDGDAFLAYADNVWTLGGGGTPATVPTPRQPHGTVSDARPIFSWDSVAGATWYRIYINRNGTHHWNKWTQEATWTPWWDMTDYAGNYEWWVQTWGPGGYGPWSSSLTFTVAGEEPPGATTLRNPSGSVTETRPTFTWDTVSGATWYRIWLHRDGAYHWDKWTQEATWSPWWDMTDYPGNYEWWVQAWARGEYGPWSGSLSFTIAGEESPGATTLRTPTETVVAGDVTFSWDAIDGATWYHFWLNKDGAEDDSAWLEGGTTRTLTLSAGQYEYWVRTWGAGGYGPWSSGRSFTVSEGGAPPEDEFVLIPAGTNSGTNPLAAGEFSNATWYPQNYSLTVSAFYMGKHEVTKAKWDEVRTWGVNHGYADLPSGDGKSQTHSVYNVNWYDVVKWCNARSEKVGRTPCYYCEAGQATVYRTGEVDLNDDCIKWFANGYRLPTDEEWEYAARGGLTGKRFPWGDTIDHSRANYQANGSAYGYDVSAYTEYTYHPSYDDGGHPYTSPVGAFAANAYDLRDMAGNLGEWCGDWYPGYEGSLRVNRGGCWGHYASYCRAGDRYENNPVSRLSTVGFRACSAASVR